MKENIVVALGGNALGYKPEEQKENVKTAARVIVDLYEAGYRITICHGNGPQVGLLKSSMDTANLVNMPFAECTAMSQGYIGFHLQNGIKNELKRRGLDENVLTMITQVIVDVKDPGFANPTKPIGNFLTKEEAEALNAQGIPTMEDSNRGYRQVVASPKPVGIVEEAALKEMAEMGIVIAGGGGGVPVILTEDGYEGVSAVVDKDLTSVEIAKMVDASTLLILTAVDQVALDFLSDAPQWQDEFTTDDAEKYLQEGEFLPGSMDPKVEAAIKFNRSKPSRRTIITSLEKATSALNGTSGTRFVNEN